MRSAIALIAIIGCQNTMAAQAQELLPPDPARGIEIWAKCKACHTLEANGRHIVGPRLHDLFGRKAGTQPGYNYSSAMLNSGIIWADETLDKYLAATQDFMPGNKMYGGLAIRQERLDLIAWLKQATR